MLHDSANALKMLVLEAPAKINLFLNVKKELTNKGFHFLDSLILPVSLYDSISMQIFPAGALAQEAGIDLQFKPDLSCPISRSTVYKAVLAMRDAFKNGKRTEDFLIAVQKRIPEKSGLGGGSSDAAAVILALCVLWGLDPLSDEVIAVASLVGADVPFFLFSAIDKADASLKDTGVKDAGSGRKDAGASVADAILTPKDAGASVADAILTPKDTGASVADAALTPKDTGGRVADANIRDVPHFFERLKAVYVAGMGEKFEYVLDALDLNVVLVKSADAGVSTAQAYQTFDKEGKDGKSAAKLLAAYKEALGEQQALSGIFDASAISASSGASSASVSSQNNRPCFSGNAPSSNACSSNIFSGDLSSSNASSRNTFSSYASLSNAFSISAPSSNPSSSNASSISVSSSNASSSNPYSSSAYQRLFSTMGNNLESVALKLAPSMQKVRRFLITQDGVATAMVTGSGSCVFGICTTFQVAEEIACVARKRGWWAEAVTTRCPGLKSVPC